MHSVVRFYEALKAQKIPPMDSMIESLKSHGNKMLRLHPPVRSRAVIDVCSFVRVCVCHGTCHRLSTKRIQAGTFGGFLRAPRKVVWVSQEEDGLPSLHACVCRTYVLARQQILTQEGWTDASTHKYTQRIIYCLIRLHPTILFLIPETRLFNRIRFFTVHIFHWILYIYGI